MYPLGRKLTHSLRKRATNETFAQSLLFSRGSITALSVRFGSSIKVLLLKELENKGKQGEVIPVKRGYARNYLIPRKIAAYATEENIARLMAEMKDLGISDADAAAAAALQALKEEERALKALSKSEVRRLEFTRSAAEEGVLFGSVTIADIVEKFSEVNVDVRVVNLLSPIKNLGEFKIEIDGIDIVIDVKRQ